MRSDAEAAAGGSVTIYSGCTQNLVEPILNVRRGDRDLRRGPVRQHRRPGAADRGGGRAVTGRRVPVPVARAPWATSTRRVCWAPSPMTSSTWSRRASTPPTAAGSVSPAASEFSPTTRSTRTNLPCRTPCRSRRPRVKGRLGVAPSNASFEDFVTAMRFRIGDEATKEWLRGIADNDVSMFA